MVIFGHSVLAVGLNFSAVRFLFIWLSSFGLMDPPRINAFSLYVRYSDPVRSLINSLFFVQPFQCTVCDPSRGFHGLSNCREHQNVHKNSKPWKCEICGLGFDCRANKFAHVKGIHEGIKRKSKQCARHLNST